MSTNLDRDSKITQARYDRIAPVYDAMEWVIERLVFGSWRRELWAGVPDGRVLEVGVGTGKNMPYYRPGMQVTGIDLSERMLSRARKRAEKLGVHVGLQQMNAQQLAFPDATFDSAVATFVFCSVPMPVQGLQELGRVVRPGADIWLLEHVRIDRPLIGRIMDVLNPLAVSVMGANINRQTVANVRKAGLALAAVAAVGGDLVKLIHART
jgi:ubiquinone/menaquinone biosynthesis C-methylase UbiE